MRSKHVYILALYISIIGWAYFNKEDLIGWIQTTDSTPIIVIFLGAVLIAIVPILPFGVVGGILGAKYGFLGGGLLSLVASSFASVIMCYLFNYLFKTQGMRYLQKSNHIQQWDKVIRKHMFWSILIARIIPIMPSAFINCYAGVFNLPIKSFLLATVIGKIPPMLVFAYVGDNIFSGSRQWLSIAVIYLLFLGAVYLIYRFYDRRSAS
ncbi:TVP38/TMEM64 family protein [Paenibacillus andongensis]|uniref:TVP38/TMEM64 family protein n=1 Tax=Paenibacillus andongensis TaxID=2975482 RepID=UPI0021BAC650|nr:VTT domain-containing protein [Paenibacillus andongensis]